MDPNLLDKLLAAQDAFLAAVDKEVESLRKSQTPSDDAVKAKEEILSSERTRLENLEASKKQSLARFDAEIKRRNDRVKSLEKEIADDRKNLKAAEKPTAAKKDEPAPEDADKKQKPKKPSGKDDT